MSITFPLCSTGQSVADFTESSIPTQDSTSSFDVRKASTIGRSRARPGDCTLGAHRFRAGRHSSGAVTPDAHTLLFLISVVAIVPLAALLSRATEAVAARTAAACRISRDHERPRCAGQPALPRRTLEMRDPERNLH
ncbi:hypothetical protein BN77_3191 [Rhizobium mesoamericanum STM3625]|uniref:Uncharacterized protein n=1 Tax=Rhizobium mesoamericanum STM3625 TaxID=1211777 RepID=K0Q0W0_9HYPH|nr:hypothetical protein BN77_3191 [Rhizobium mesoamericanum STM3625]